MRRAILPARVSVQIKVRVLHRGNWCHRIRRRRHLRRHLGAISHAKLHLARVFVAFEFDAFAESDDGVHHVHLHVRREPFFTIDAHVTQRHTTSRLILHRPPLTIPSRSPAVQRILPVILRQRVRPSADGEFPARDSIRHPSTHRTKIRPSLDLIVTLAIIEPENDVILLVRVPAPRRAQRDDRRAERRHRDGDAARLELDQRQTLRRVITRRGVARTQRRAQRATGRALIDARRRAGRRVRRGR